MIRLVWRQSRVQFAVAFGAVVVVAIFAFITGPHLVHLYDTNVVTCVTRDDCSTATSSFLRIDGTVRTWLGILVIVVPGIIGMFWGAPLVARELEAGTHRLVWTQSVTRTHWLAVKLSVVGLASMIVTGLLSLILTWWASPFDRATMNIFGTFDQRDIVPIGYAAFAFVLGVTAGVVIRRTLPAMATTLFVFVAVRLSFTHWIRPHLISPVNQSIALNPATGGWGYGSESSLFGPSFSNTLIPGPSKIPNAWVYETQIVDKAGHGLTSQFVARACPLLVGNGQAGAGAGSGQVEAPTGAGHVLPDCVRKVGATFHEVMTYQPSSRYWAFQWYELAIYVSAVAILGGLCLWWVRRQLS